MDGEDEGLADVGVAKLKIKRVVVRDGSRNECKGCQDREAGKFI